MLHHVTVNAYNCWTNAELACMQTHTEKEAHQRHGVYSRQREPLFLHTQQQHIHFIILLLYKCSIQTTKWYFWITQSFRLYPNVKSPIYSALNKIKSHQIALKLTSYSNSASSRAISDMYGQIFALPRANSPSCYSKDYFLTQCRLYCWVADEKGENSGDVLLGAPGRIQTTVDRVLLFGELPALDSEILLCFPGARAGSTKVTPL